MNHRFLPRCLALASLVWSIYSPPPALSLWEGEPGSLWTGGLAYGAPAARREPQEAVLHGERRVDDYAWLRRTGDPQVMQHLKDENAFTEQWLRSSAALQQALFKEAMARIKQTDQTVPYKEGDFLYYARLEKGKQHPIYLRKAAGAGAREQVVLDVNALSRGAAAIGLLSLTISDDGNLLAYGQDTSGAGQFTLFIKDLRTEKPGSQPMERVASFAWAEGPNLFYVVEDKARRPSRLYHRVVGQPGEDRLVYEEKDPLFRLSVSRTHSRAYLLATSASPSATEVRFLPAKEPAGTWTVMAPRIRDRAYYVDHGAALPGREPAKGPPPKPAPGQKVVVTADLGEELFFIRENGCGRNFCLAVARPAAPGPKDWLEVLPHSDDAVLSDLLVFAGHFVVLERIDGLTKIRVTERRTGAARRLGFPDPVYSVQPADNRDYQSTVFRFFLQTFTKPVLVFDHDMIKHQNVQLTQIEVLASSDPARYETERRKARAPDGTEVPVSIVYRKGLARDGKAPLLLTGYGAYGVPAEAVYSPSLLSLLDRGVVYAVAHVRGGGELGRRWHDGGRRLNKKNAMADLIAVAEFLAQEKYTAPGRTVLTGKGAGGLLVTAAAHLRPEMWRGVVADAPFVDLINTLMDESLPGSLAKSEEWGSPKAKAEYDYLKSYSPYDNLTAREYPAMLVLGGLNDSQVMYWEPAKYAARLRAVKTDRNPVLLRMNLSAGHDGPSGRYDRLREQSVVNAWILQQLGVRR